jgi:hypothetical protein
MLVRLDRQRALRDANGAVYDGHSVNAVSAPVLFAHARRAWLALGDRLHRVTSPLVLGALYFLLFTPVALIMRLAGRDALCRRFDPGARSYWVERPPPAAGDGGFADEF